MTPPAIERCWRFPDDGGTRRGRGRLGALVVAGALLSTGALAGCEDSSDPGAAERSTPPATGLEGGSVVPASSAYVNPDVNREGAWEKAGVRPNDP